MKKNVANSNLPVFSPNGVFSIAVKSDNNLVQKCFIVTLEHLGSSIMCFLEKPFSFWNLSASRFFSNYGHSPVILFFSNFTFLGCFCFWMVEFLDFSPFKFTLSKLCKTYHLILQTSYTEKYSLHLWLWTVSPTCYKFPRYILALKYLFVFSMKSFHRFQRKCQIIFNSAEIDLSPEPGFG